MRVHGLELLHTSGKCQLFFFGMYIQYGPVKKTAHLSRHRHMQSDRKQTLHRHGCFLPLEEGKVQNDFAVFLVKQKAFYADQKHTLATTKSDFRHNLQSSRHIRGIKNNPAPLLATTYPS